MYEQLLKRIQTKTDRYYDEHINGSWQFFGDTHFPVPTQSYNPATKGYVDNVVTNGISNISDNRLPYVLNGSLMDSHLYYDYDIFGKSSVISHLDADISLNFTDNNVKLSAAGAQESFLDINLNGHTLLKGASSILLLENNYIELSSSQGMIMMDHENMTITNGNSSIHMNSTDPITLSSPGGMDFNTLFNDTIMSIDGYDIYIGNSGFTEITGSNLNVEVDAMNVNSKTFNLSPGTSTYLSLPLKQTSTLTHICVVDNTGLTRKVTPAELKTMLGI